MWPFQDKVTEFDHNTAMRRLIYFVLLGSSFIFIYAARWGFFCVLPVGLMTAGAALSAGGLLGFLFGIPHTRDGAQSNSEIKNESGQEAGPRTPEAFSTYRPNTSLEQIADWLTKMLVGVGLVEIKTISAKITELTNYIAAGLGAADQSKVFALSLLTYFALCGFVFGFLWARLYLPKWFSEADKVDRLEKKVSQLESKLQADAKALALATHQLKRTGDDPAGSDQELAEAIRAASSGTRDLIFDLADQTYEEHRGKNRSDDDQTWVQGITSILKALISMDVEERKYEYHSLLSHVQRRTQDLEAALGEISKAIEIRDKLKKRGWKWYEFHRARSRIENDSSFAANKPSDPATVSQVRSDLQQAFSDKNWARWYKEHAQVQEWMKLNLAINDGQHEPKEG